MLSTILMQAAILSANEMTDILVDILAGLCIIAGVVVVTMSECVAPMAVVSNVDG